MTEISAGDKGRNTVWKADGGSQVSSRLSASVTEVAALQIEIEFVFFPVPLKRNGLLVCFWLLLCRGTCCILEGRRRSHFDLWVGMKEDNLLCLFPHSSCFCFTCLFLQGSISVQWSKRKPVMCFWSRHDWKNGLVYSLPAKTLNLSCAFLFVSNFHRVPCIHEDYNPQEILLLLSMDCFPFLFAEARSHTCTL